MELLETILKRKSVRDYTDEEIPNEKLEKILQAGLLAPTSRNRRPCEFIVIEDKKILKKLAEAKESGSRMLAGCNKAIAVFANTETSDTWIEDSSIALGYMHLMAAEQDIGSCWCQMHLRYSSNGESSEEIARNILSMSEEYRIVGILALGISKDAVNPHTLDEIDESKISYF